MEQMMNDPMAMNEQIETLSSQEMADQALRNPGSMTGGAPEMEMGAQNQIQSQLDELM